MAETLGKWILLANEVLKKVYHLFQKERYNSLFEM